MMDNIGIIYKILKALEKSMDSEDFDEKCISSSTLRITETRRLYILQMLLEAGLIAGFNIEIGIAGDFYISKGRPRLTLKGVEYMENNTAFQRFLKEAKGVKDAIPGA